MTSEGRVIKEVTVTETHDAPVIYPNPSPKRNPYFPPFTVTYNSP